MPDLYTPITTEPFSPPTLQQRISQALDVLRGKLTVPTAQPPTPSLKSEPQAQDGVKTQDDPAGRALPDANYISAVYRNYSELLLGNPTRRARYKDYEAMDKSQVAAMLDAVVDSCLVSDDGKLNGIAIEAGGKVETVLNDLIKSTNLNAFLRVALRDFLKYGDNWIGVVYDDNLNIVGFDNPPPAQMWTFVDDNMRLLTGTEDVVMGNRRIQVAKAYQQKTDALQTVAGWQPFEMVHMRFRPSNRLIYSDGSFLEDMREDWYKIRLIEESLVLHRVTRAAPRGQHFIDVTGMTDQQAKEAIDNYVAMVTQSKLSNGENVKTTIAVDEDLYASTAYRQAPDGKLYPSLNRTEFHDPRNTGLQSLPDVEHFVKKMFSRVPAEIVGILPDRQDISTQDIAASRFYANLQYQLEHQFLRFVFDLALLLKGFKPTKDSYKLIFPNVQLRTSWRFADARFRQSLADANDIESGVNTRKNIAQDKYNWTDDRWEEHVSQFKKEQDIFLPPEPAPAVGTNVGAKGKKVTQIRKGQNSA